MKKKRFYEEARMKVVNLSEKSALLSGSSPVEGSSGAPGMTLGGYSNGAAQFQ